MGDQLLALVLAKFLGRRLDTNAERVEKHAQMSTHSPAVEFFVSLGFRSFALGIGNWGVEIWAADVDVCIHRWRSEFGSLQRQDEKK